MENVATDLKNRFDFARYIELSRWEYEPNGMIDENTVRDCTPEEIRVIDAFECLLDTLANVPKETLNRTETLRASVGEEKYEEIAVRAVQSVPDYFLPKDATEFVESLNRSLHAASLRVITGGLDSVQSVQLD